MAQDTQSKKERPATGPQETKMRRYEYQKEDSRSFNVQYKAPTSVRREKDEKQAAPTMSECTLRIF